MARRRCAPSIREDYLDFLWSARKTGARPGRPGDAAGLRLAGRRRRPLPLDRVDARLGQYSFDASSPIAEGTWEGAYWGAQTALTALDAVLGGERAAFALCRPPGHHCGADYLGGYCYLNNAAIAAEAAVARRPPRRHPRHRLSSRQRHPGHLLRARRRAVRLDPRRPAHRLSLLLGPCRRDRRRARARARPSTCRCRAAPPSPIICRRWRRRSTAIAGFAPDLLVCSFGADTFAGDPISHFRLETADYAELGRRIAALGVPTPDRHGRRLCRGRARRQRRGVPLRLLTRFPAGSARFRAASFLARVGPAWTSTCRSRAFR